MRACRTNLAIAIGLLYLVPRALTAQTATDGSLLTLLSDAQHALAAELAGAHRGDLVRLPATYWRVRAEVERRTRLSWRGPDPLVVLAGHFPGRIACDVGRCDARLESVRAIAGDDSMVASVVVVSSATLLDDHVWEHELTHALLMQHGRVQESARHDPRWFPRTMLAAR